MASGGPWFVVHDNTMSSFEEAKSYLLKDTDGVNLYTHLSNVLLEILTERPENAVELFESVSTEVKRKRFGGGLDGTGGETHDESPEDVAAAEAQAANASRIAKLFRPFGDGDEDAPDANEDAMNAVQDLTNELDAFEWAGVGVGREEGFRIFLAMKHLAASLESAPESIRFWGKILGTSSDYYVVESLTSFDGEEGEDLEGDNGPNKYTYHVCSELGGAWTKLPHATASSIVASRKIRRYFTGNLESRVDGHPPFPGNEAVYLRAQIARITAATSVSPSGAFSVADEEAPYSIAPTVYDEEAPEPKTAEELSDLGSWVHHVMEIGGDGRCVPNAGVDEDGEPVENAPEVEPLRALSEDAPVGGEDAGADWVVRTCPSSSMTGSSAMSSIRSLRWPGATAIAFGTRFSNLYIGWGHADKSVPYTPEVPLSLAVEYDDSELKEAEDVTEDPNPPEEEEGGEEDE